MVPLIVAILLSTSPSVMVHTVVSIHPSTGLIGEIARLTHSVDLTSNADNRRRNSLNLSTKLSPFKSPESRTKSLSECTEMLQWLATHWLLARTIFIVFGFLLMDRLKFLTPYRQVIFRDYGWALGLYAVLLFANLFAAFFLLARKFSLKHTGLGKVSSVRRGSPIRGHL